MKAFFAVYKRRPLFPALISLLLLLAVSLSVSGAAMLTSARKQSAGITDEYVTIAVPIDRRTYTWEEKENGLANEAPIIPYYLVNEAVMNSGFVQDVDYRYILGAEVKGSKAITSGYKDVLDYNADFDEPCYNMAVFAVKCIKSEMPSFDEEGEDGTPIDTGSSAYYFAETEIIDVISLADGYPDIYDSTALIDTHEHGIEVHEVEATVPVPATMRIYGTLFTPDGDIPFKQGHTYLVYGFYHDYPVDTIKTQTSVITGRILDYGRQFSLLDETRRFIKLPGTAISDFEKAGDDAMQVKRDYTEDGMPYLYPNEEMLPRWAEYSGSWEDFLASDEGRIWREEIIPLCKVNQSSATVIVTDNVRSMYVFNTGVAGLLEGRFFNDEDYAGRSVCMISAAYAQYNGYKIGDKLTLDFYDTGFFASETIPRGSCLNEDRMNVTGEYEIVGIYSAPEFSQGEQLFCADTILIPKKAVSGSEEFSTRPSNRLITSLILKNGTKESFLSYMEQEGYKDAYICFDQNFGAAEVSIDALVKNGRMLLWIGIAAFIITAALAHFLTMRRFAPSAKTMRILGIDRKVVAKQAVGAFILIDAIAALLGAGLAAALFSTVTEKAVSTALSPDYPVIAACAAAAFLLLAVISLLCAKALSNVPLLQTEKKGLK